MSELLISEAPKVGGWRVFDPLKLLEILFLGYVEGATMMLGCGGLRVPDFSVRTSTDIFVVEMFTYARRSSKGRQRWRRKRRREGACVASSKSPNSHKL